MCFSSFLEILIDSLIRREPEPPTLGVQNLHLYGRYSDTGENVCAPSTPYTMIEFQLDPTRTFPVSSKAQRHKAPHGFPHQAFLSVSATVDSSYTFRGTLINGILQPNVRLGNGLAFSVSKPPAAKDSALDLEETPQHNQDQISTSLANKLKAVHLRDQERILAHYENAVRWEEKAQHLVQDLIEIKLRHRQEVSELKKELAEANAKLYPHRFGKLAKQRPSPAKHADVVARTIPTIREAPAERSNRPKPRTNRRLRREKENKERAQSIFEFLSQDDATPTNALEFLQKDNQKD